MVVNYLSEMNWKYWFVHLLENVTILVKLIQIKIEISDGIKFGRWRKVLVGCIPTENSPLP